MAVPMHMEFKHQNLVVQVMTEPRLNGEWQGVLVGPIHAYDLVNTLATALQFNVPYSVATSVCSSFKVGSREPMAVITEVVQNMRTQIPNFIGIPYELWFTVFQSHMFIVQLRNPTKLNVGMYGSSRQPNLKFVERLMAMGEVQTAVDNEGQYPIVLHRPIEDARTLIELGGKIAQTYQNVERR